VNNGVAGSKIRDSSDRLKAIKLGDANDKITPQIRHVFCYDTVHYRIGVPNEKNLYNEERKKKEFNRNVI